MNKSIKAENQTDINAIIEKLLIVSKSRKATAKEERIKLIAVLSNAVYNHFKSNGFIAVGKESINALFLENKERSQSQNYRIMALVIDYLIQKGKIKEQQYFKVHAKLINKPLYCFDSGVIGHKTLKFKPSFNDFFENDFSTHDISVSIPTYKNGSVTPSPKSAVIQKFKTQCINYLLL